MHLKQTLLFLVLLSLAGLSAQRSEPPRVFFDFGFGGTCPSFAADHPGTEFAFGAQTYLGGAITFPVFTYASIGSGIGLTLRRIRQESTVDTAPVVAESTATYFEWPVLARIFLNEHQVGLYLPLRSSLGFLVGDKVEAERFNPRDPDTPILLPGRDVDVRSSAHTLATGIGWRFDRGPRRHGYFELTYQFSTHPVLDRATVAPGLINTNYLRTAGFRALSLSFGIQL